MGWKLHDRQGFKHATQILLVFILMANFVVAGTGVIALTDFADNNGKIEKINDKVKTVIDTQKPEIVFQIGVDSLVVKPSIIAAGVNDNGKIKYQNDKHEYHVYEKTVDGTQATEIELFLKEKPLLNTFDIPIIISGLIFEYQPALDTEPIEQRDLGVVSCTATDCIDEKGSIVTHRPENVVGSYAVFSKTGKVMHIYRPHIVDSIGAQTWGELSISDNLITVTVPQDFLDNATYPVYVDPTFGKTSIGGTTGASSVIIATNYLSPAAGTITDLNIYGSCTGCKLVVAIYQYTSTLNGSVGALLASETTGVITPSSASWFTVPISYSNVADTNYYLTFDANASFTRYYDAVADARIQAFQTVNNPAETGVWPDPFNTASGNHQARGTSIHAIYTASGGGDTCTYTTGNWVVDCSDNCVINTSYNLAYNDLNVVGTGSFKVNRDLNNVKNLFIQGTSSSNICSVEFYNSRLNPGA